MLDVPWREYSSWHPSEGQLDFILASLVTSPSTVSLCGNILPNSFKTDFWNYIGLRVFFTKGNPPRTSSNIDSSEKCVLQVMPAGLRS